MTKEQAQARADVLTGRDGKLRTVKGVGHGRYGTVLLDTRIATKKRSDDEWVTSGRSRTYTKAHLVERAVNNRAFYKRKKEYLAKALEASPEKRHYVNGPKSVVILSDLQIPYEDPAAVNEALNLVHKVKPDMVILNGDIIDCYAESSFLQDPNQAAIVIPETHARVRDLMATLEDVPYKYWLGGNHEDRWKKVLWKGGDTALKLAKAHEAVIGRPVGLRNPLSSFEDMYDINKHGFTYHEWHHRLYLAEGNLLVTHGEYASKHSAYSAKMTWEKFGKSCIVGHTHRLGSYLITQDGREHGAWENGCLCQLEPEYDTAPNWQQGFSVVHIDGPEFHVIQVPIVRRNSKPVAVYNG